jgi:hypothetical protein
MYLMNQSLIESKSEYMTPENQATAEDTQRPVDVLVMFLWRTI